MVVTGDDLSRITWLISQLAHEFSIKDLGFLHHFLGIEVHRIPTGLFLSQHRYAPDLLERASMSSCKPISTPMPSKGQHLPNCNELYPNPTHYRSMLVVFNISHSQDLTSLIVLTLYVNSCMLLPWPITSLLNVSCAMFVVLLTLVCIF